MPSTIWVGIFIVIALSVIINGVVKIIKASGSGGSKAVKAKLDSLGDSVTSIEQDLEDARERIEVLEKIVTDDKHNLSREIDDLEKNG